MIKKELISDSNQTYSIRDGVKKKLVVLGGDHHEVAFPPSPHPVVVKLPLFCGKFFLLRTWYILEYFADMEK